jgi:hypothetical protein
MSDESSSDSDNSDDEQGTEKQLCTKCNVEFLSTDKKCSSLRIVCAQCHAIDMKEVGEVLQNNLNDEKQGGNDEEEEIVDAEVQRVEGSYDKCDDEEEVLEDAEVENVEKSNNERSDVEKSDDFESVTKLLLDADESVTFHTNALTQCFIRHYFGPPNNRKSVVKTFVDVELSSKIELAKFDLVSAHVGSNKAVTFTKAVVKDSNDTLFTAVCMLRQKRAQAIFEVILHQGQEVIGKRFSKVRLSEFKLNYRYVEEKINDVDVIEQEFLDFCDAEGMLQVDGKPAYDYKGNAIQNSHNSTRRTADRPPCFLPPPAAKVITFLFILYISF